MHMALTFTADKSLQPRSMPSWVPDDVLHYLAHTEAGESIRALARDVGCHPSTILRQIRKLETRRDDPLVDAALRKLGTILCPMSVTSTGETDHMSNQYDTNFPDEATLNRESMRVLRRLCETGAVLAVAAEMEKAVVVRDMPGGSSTRTAVVDASIAQAMALKDWIAAANRGRIVRYHITPVGRTALDEMLRKLGAHNVLPEQGMAENHASFVGTDWAEELPSKEMADAASRRIRYALAESPLSALARRRDKGGEQFLGDDLVAAGEKLREDFELAQMGASVTQNWDAFLTAGCNTGSPKGNAGHDAPTAARARVSAALEDLGPGLADVALRCCCFLEGLETTEQRLGWSARSGKIVLRIALMRLKRHYDETTGPGGPMIG